MQLWSKRARLHLKTASQTSSTTWHQHPLGIGIAGMMNERERRSWRFTQVPEAAEGRHYVARLNSMKGDPERHKVGTLNYKGDSRVVEMPGLRCSPRKAAGFFFFSGPREMSHVLDMTGLEGESYSRLSEPSCQTHHHQREPSTLLWPPCLPSHDGPQLFLNCDPK